MKMKEIGPKGARAPLALPSLDPPMHCRNKLEIRALKIIIELLN